MGYRYYTTVSQFEQGASRVPPEHWVKYARLYKVDPAEFAKKLLSFYDPHVHHALFANHKERAKD